jgi:hypothetical protein
MNISAASPLLVGHALNVRGFVLVELREHVIREVAPASPRVDADPQPREFIAKLRDDRLQPLWPPGRSAGPRPQLRQRQMHFVDDHQQVSRLDLKYRSKPPTASPLAFMKVIGWPAACRDRASAR